MAGNREQSKTADSRNDMKMQLQIQQPQTVSQSNIGGSRQGKRVESLSNLNDS